MRGVAVVGVGWGYIVTSGGHRKRLAKCAIRQHVHVSLVATVVCCVAAAGTTGGGGGGLTAPPSPCAPS